jgi:hypothetical protein
MAAVVGAARPGLAESPGDAPTRNVIYHIVDIDTSVEGSR